MIKFVLLLLPWERFSKSKKKAHMHKAKLEKFCFPRSNQLIAGKLPEITDQRQS